MTVNWRAVPALLLGRRVRLRCLLDRGVRLRCLLGRGVRLRCLLDPGFVYASCVLAAGGGSKAASSSSPDMAGGRDHRLGLAITFTLAWIALRRG